MPSIYRLLKTGVAVMQRVPDLERAVSGFLQAAETNDVEAVKLWAATDGWRDGLAVVSPELRNAAVEAMPDFTRGIARIRRRINGEPEPEALTPTADPKLDRFMRWLTNRVWGVFLILGPKGRGKTAKALRLAEVWHNQDGADVWGVGIWPEDGLPFITPVDMEELEVITEVIKLQMRGLTALFEEWAEEDDEPRKKKRKLPKIPLSALMDKIIVIDESSLQMGNSGTDRGRKVLRRLFGIARHMRWRVVFTSILARQVPLDSLNAEMIAVVEPSGREVLTDRPDSPDVVTLWRDAGKTFRDDIAGHPYRKDYPRNVAWAHIGCPEADYFGPMPFKLPGQVTPPARSVALAVPTNIRPDSSVVIEARPNEYRKVS